MMDREKQPVALNQTYQHVFTVFTPTYNRAYTLHRVYESLKAQTYRDFEWLIVDGGSDDTPKLVQTWCQEADFPIRYIRQKTQGLHLAFNEGVAEARGELFLFSPSDDAFFPNALERFKYHWDSISVQQKSKFSGVTCLCVDQDQNLVGHNLPQQFIDSDSQEIRYKFKISFEMWGFQRTDVMKEFPFPIIKSRHVPEAIVWGAIGLKYKTRFINEVLRIYWVAKKEDKDSNQLTGRRTSTSSFTSDPGMALFHKYILNDEISWFRYAPEEFLRSAIYYSRFSFHAGTSLVKQFRYLDTALGTLLWLIMLPCGYLIYLRDRLRS